MLARLRRNFIAVAMSIAGAVLLASLGSSFFSSYTTQQALTDDLLTRALSAESWAAARIGDGDGRGADVMLAVAVDVGFDGTVSLSSATPLTISDPALEELLAEALSSESASGRNSSYHVAWMRASTPSGWRVALADTYSRDAALRAQATMDAAIFLVAMAALLLVVRRLARWILRPVEEAWDQQRRFVSDASHELKTPLAVILANAQILETAEGVPEDARRWARSTAEEAKHMKGLVEDLLTLARADEQRASGERAAAERVDLSALVDGCALEFDAVAFERGCSIESSLEPGLSVVGDPSQLGRLVRTLLDNATKYAARGTEVRVALAREGRRCRLAVTNLGDVIAPEDLEHLFERFYRTDRARERQPQGGFGLGLAIARSIAEAHGGTIGAASSPEEGTTFTVLLPLA
ncbi:HAMP domain-containing histidine kinase [Olsenella sp. SW781]|nr:HAMP domain-containing histidine kinase [Olsenella sp. SW781]